MDLLLIVTLSCIGALIGLGVGALVPHATIGLLVFTICLFGTIGLIVAYGILYLAKTGKKQIDRTDAYKPRACERTSVRRFDLRLEDFRRLTEQGLTTEMRWNAAHRSSMPFWTSVKHFTRVSPKSSLSIRLILWKIRRILRG